MSQAHNNLLALIEEIAPELDMSYDPSPNPVDEALAIVEMDSEHSALGDRISQISTELGDPLALIIRKEKDFDHPIAFSTTVINPPTVLTPMRIHTGKDNANVVSARRNDVCWLADHEPAWTAARAEAEVKKMWEEHHMAYGAFWQEQVTRKMNALRERLEHFSLL